MIKSLISDVFSLELTTTYYNGNEVAKKLGYKSPHKALGLHVPEEYKLTSTKSTAHKYITLEGVLHLVMNSKLPTALEAKEHILTTMVPSLGLKLLEDVPTYEGLYQAKAIGIKLMLSDTGQAVKFHCKEQVKVKGYWFITELDFYRMVFNSEKPVSRKIQKHIISLLIKG